MINVLLTRKFAKEDVLYIEQKVNDSVRILNKDFNEAELALLAKKANVFFGGTLDRNLIKNAQDLKLIQIPWNGVDKLDWDLFKSLDIPVCNSRSNALVVAEFAVALMFDVCKKISVHDGFLRRGYWNRVVSEGTNDISPFSSQIYGSKIGILGFGNIGSLIGNFLSPYNCTFRVFNRSGIAPTELKSYEFFSSSQLSDNVADLDFLFVCVPLTNDTRGFVNKRIFDKMNKSCKLINISRGDVINEEDLFDALVSGKIAGAGLDTWYKYPSKLQKDTLPSINYPFHELLNVTMSPHRAGYIDNGFPHLDDAIENLNRLTRGDKLINKVTTRYES